MSAGERPYITFRELLDFLYLYLEDDCRGIAATSSSGTWASVPPAGSTSARTSSRSGSARPPSPTRTGRPSEEAPEELVQAILKSRAKA